jgi:tripartite-type tricarboxylate transporter receptor subunit TctC
MKKIKGRNGMFGNGIIRKWSGVGAGLLAMAAVLSAGASSVSAQSPANFYKGKNVRLMIGYGPGGSYDSYGRLVARHLGKFIPGKPTVVPQNKPGSGSLVASNYLYTVAPRDGSVLAAIGGIVMLIGGAGKEPHRCPFRLLRSQFPIH